VDATELQRVPALLELSERGGAAYEQLAEVAARAFACPMQIWPGARLLVGLPGDPSRATPPHQDSRGLDWIGDYRRLWIALGEIPFGDGGLALAPGSHRYRRLPLTELIDDDWHTAAMTTGDLFTFDLNLVHRSLPATSDRIRIALTMIASAQWDPRPSMVEDPLQPGASPLGLCEQEALAGTAP
jgi:ectoine hydroxylase-related dioxygenase (phytanoyl-CoA dioxygenase family)